MMETDNSVKGTKFKLNVYMPPMEGHHLEDVDFECLVFVENGIKNKKILKKDAIRVDADNYMICVDSSMLGAGRYWMTMTAYIPDSDCDDGIRPEIKTRFTGVTINAR